MKKLAAKIALGLINFGIAFYEENKEKWDDEDVEMYGKLVQKRNKLQAVIA